MEYVLVLDIQVWVTETEKGTLTSYEFYRKPMANPISIPAESALSNNVKFSTYRQEVVRVLKNTAVHIPWSRKASLLSELSHRMQLAGYTRWDSNSIYMKRFYVILEEYLFIIRERKKWRVPPHYEGISLHFRYLDIWGESTSFWKNISSLFESEINEEFHLIMKEYLFI